MRQADQERQTEAIAALLDARRKKTKEPAGIAFGPNQHRAGIGSEDRRGGQRKSGLVKDIRLKRGLGKFPPSRHD